MSFNGAIVALRVVYHQQKLCYLNFLVQRRAVNILFAHIGYFGDCDRKAAPFCNSDRIRAESEGFGHHQPEGGNQRHGRNKSPDYPSPAVTPIGIGDGGAIGKQPRGAGLADLDRH